MKSFIIPACVPARAGLSRSWLPPLAAIYVRESLEGYSQ